MRQSFCNLFCAALLSFPAAADDAAAGFAHATQPNPGPSSTATHTD
jgi:hypothetical protein